jgi:hypothetical protein
MARRKTRTRVLRETLTEMPTAEHAVTNRDIQDRVLTLENKVGTISEDLQDVRRDIHSGFARLETTGALQKDKENDNRKFIIQIALALLATMFSAVFGVILPAILAAASLVFFVIDSRTSTAIAPVKEQAVRTEEAVKNLETTYLPSIVDLREKVNRSAEADTNSRTDREDLRRNQQSMLASISKIQTDLAADHAERIAKETEIETQFNADNQLRNVQFSDQQRINSNFQNALSGLGAKMPEYPSNPFFQPNISQQQKNNQ